MRLTARHINCPTRVGMQSVSRGQLPVAIADVIGFEPRIIWDVCAKSYQDLDVWQRAVDWAEAIYRVTREFPREEQFGLSSQLRRAAVSVACNIAEGAERASSKEKYQFVCVALGSLAEVETLLILSARVELVSEATKNELIEESAQLGKMLHGLRRSFGART